MRHFIALKWQVIAAAMPDDHSACLSAAGVIVRPVPWVRGGVALKNDWVAFRSLLRIYREYKPCLVHHFNVKPVFIGTMAAGLVGGAKIVNTMTGLGYVFGREDSIARRIITAGYQLFLPRSAATMFENSHDRQLFIHRRYIPESKARLIMGAGVDISRFQPPATFDDHNTPCVVMVARLLWQKGVREFIEAVRLVKRQFPNARFLLAGEWDTSHPDAVPETWVQEKVDEGEIEFLGYVSNLEEVLSTAYTFVLPSLYREGMPRVLLEAAACGVPVITFDVPGCRDAVINGETGIVVPARNIQSLADAVDTLLREPALRHRLGQAGRRRAVAEFDKEIVTAKQLQTYRDIGIDV